MNEKDLIASVEAESLVSKDLTGLEFISKDDFLESISYESRLIGFIGKGEDIEVVMIPKSTMDDNGLSFKDLKNDFPSLNWRNQSDKDLTEIGPEQNIKTLETYESFKSLENINNKKETRKSIRSVDYRPKR